MPKRVIDFDAMWGSDKIAACAEWAQTEYAWLYGLADPSGCFEVTNLRVIWGRVAAIRRNLTIERLEQVFGEFQDKGLLFVWEQDGKRYGHWTGSDVPGRLPPPSWRMRLERLAPPVPKQLLAEYVSRFARGRAASLGGGFLSGAQDGENRKPENSNLKERGIAGAVGAGGEYSRGAANAIAERQVQDDLKFQISNLKNDAQPRGHGRACTGICKCEGAPGEAWRAVEAPGEIEGATGVGRGESSRYGSEWTGLKEGVEETHTQDLDLGLELDLEPDEKGVGASGPALRGRAADPAGKIPDLFFDLNPKATSNAQTAEAETRAAAHTPDANTIQNINANAPLDSKSNSQTSTHSWAQGSISDSGTAATDAGRRPGKNASTGCATRENVFRNKAELLERELRVGQGPSSLGPVRVKPEALERIRLRNASRGGSRSG